MKILIDNVDFSSRSGPNCFASKLAKQISYSGHIVADPNDYDVALAFIQTTRAHKKPVVHRLDGIWFNNEQQYEVMNKPIEATYNNADAVIFQSSFNKKLTEAFFGAHKNSYIIHNGADTSLIDSLDTLDIPQLEGFQNVYVCASTWRPHKRLSENVRYFMETAGSNDCLIIAGKNPDVKVADPRVFYAGDLEYESLLQLCISADYFLHLAWLDHCPNVVIDARACGAHIICSSSGGTREIAGPDAIVIKEDEFDFKPCRLYHPPKLDFSRREKNDEYDSTISMVEVTKKYVSILESIKK